MDAHSTTVVYSCTLTEQDPFVAAIAITRNGKEIAICLHAKSSPTQFNAYATLSDETFPSQSPDSRPCRVDVVRSPDVVLSDIALAYSGNGRRLLLVGRSTFYKVKFGDEHVPKLVGYCWDTTSQTIIQSINLGTNIYRDSPICFHIRCSYSFRRFRSNSCVSADSPVQTFVVFSSNGSVVTRYLTERMISVVTCCGVLFP